MYVKNVHPVYRAGNQTHHFQSVSLHPLPLDQGTRYITFNLSVISRNSMFCRVQICVVKRYLLSHGCKQLAELSTTYLDHKFKSCQCKFYWNGCFVLTV